jgi:hypothetical protein
MASGARIIACTRSDLRRVVSAVTSADEGASQRRLASGDRLGVAHLGRGHRARRLPAACAVDFEIRARSQPRAHRWRGTSFVHRRAAHTLADVAAGTSRVAVWEQVAAAEPVPAALVA